MWNMYIVTVIEIVDWKNNASLTVLTNSTLLTNFKELNLIKIIYQKDYCMVMNTLGYEYT